MNEREIARKLVGYLNRGAADLKPGTAYRLQLARERALAEAEQERRCHDRWRGDRLDQRVC